MPTLQASDRLRMAPPLRKSGPCIAVSASLIVVLAIAVLVNLGLLAGMGPDVAGVFFRALALSTLLSCVPLSVLWFLDRREREAPLFFLAAFLWGACIATAIVVPFNTAFHDLVDRWIALNPIVAEILGPDATILIAAPLAAPITEEVAKAAGVVLIFWLLHDEFDNMRDGFVYGALIGVGFNWFEAALYVAQGYAEHGRPLYGLQLGTRYALFGLGGHVVHRPVWLVSRPCRSDNAQVAPRARSSHRADPGSRSTRPQQRSASFPGVGSRRARPPAGSRSESAADLLSEMGFVAAFLSSSAIELTIFGPFTLSVAIALWRSASGNGE